MLHLKHALRQSRISPISIPLHIDENGLLRFIIFQLLDLMNQQTTTKTPFHTVNMIVINQALIMDKKKCFWIIKYESYSKKKIPNLK